MRTIALSVPDATAAYRHAVEHGARGVDTPHEIEDEHGRVQLSSVETYGDVRHLFVQRDGYDGPFLPGFESRDEAPAGPDGLLRASTTWSATSSSATWRSGSATTSASSG